MIHFKDLAMTFILGFFLLFLFENSYAKAPEEKHFTDVPLNSPYFSSIQAFAREGGVEGFADGTFRPYALISRAEFVTMLINKAHFDPHGTDCFVDVKKEWFAPFICVAAEEKLVKGYPNKYFYPQNNINFVEASAIVAKAFQLDISNYQDDKQPWYYPFVKTLERKSAIPFSITEFNHKLTRAEAAYLIFKGEGSYSSKDVFSITYDDLQNLDSLSDPQRFVYIFKKMYGKDLSTGLIPDGIDIRSFKRIGEGFVDAELFSDRNNVYCYNPKNTQLRLLKDADVNSFYAFQDILYLFVADKNNVYTPDTENCYTPAVKIDRNKKFFHKNIFKDKRYVYYFDLSFRKKNFVKVDGADAKTFGEYSQFKNLVGSKFFQDKDSLYVFVESGMRLKKLHVDKKTFTFINEDEFHNSSNDWLVFKDKNAIYYGLAGSLDELHTFEGADVKSFKLLSTSLPRGIDKNTLYAVDDFGRLRKTPGVDSPTYEIIPTQGEENVRRLVFFGKDKNKVYRSSDFSVVAWADPETFEVLAVEYGFPMDESYFVYGRSKDNFWYEDKTGDELVINDIDPDSFLILEVGEVIRHKDSGFYPSETFTWGDSAICKKNQQEFGGDGITKELDGNTRQTFENNDDGTCSIMQESFQEAHDTSLFEIIAKDKTGLWRYDEENRELRKIMLEGIDVRSFEKVFLGIYKDKTHVYAGSEFKKIENADPSTIEVRPFKGKWYLKDKQSVWEYDRNVNRIEGADSATFFLRDFEKNNTDSLLKEVVVMSNDLEKKEKLLFVDLETGKVTPFYGKIGNEDDLMDAWPEGMDIFILFTYDEVKIGVKNGNVRKVDVDFDSLGGESLRTGQNSPPLSEAKGRG